MNMIRFLTRHYSFLGASLMLEAWRDAGRCTAMTGIPDGAGDVEYARPAWWLDETWIERVSRKYVSAEPGLYWDFLKRGQDAGNALALVSRDLYETAGAGRAVPSEKGVQDFTAWTQRFQDNATFLLVTHPLAKSVEIRLLDVLKQYGVSPKDLDQALLDLSITRRSNAAEEENFDLLIIQKSRERPDFDLEAALREHTRKYAYIKYRDPFSGGYTIDHFRERLKGKLELPDYFAPCADIIGQFREDEKALVELQEEFVFYRTFRTERSYEALHYLERWLSALEDAHALGPHELSYCSGEELLHFLRAGQRVDPAVIEDRRRDVAMLLHDGAVTVLSGQGAQAWIAARSGDRHPPVTEVRGLTAYRGTVTGRARILLNTADQDGVGSGDVLIVPMTTPDYLPSMQRAAAFVTDEGGVICHAAIIARELKKPCVIGTKRATSVFRDGDWIEVDGFKGVVRLVSSSSRAGAAGT